MRPFDHLQKGLLPDGNAKKIIDDFTVGDGEE